LELESSRSRWAKADNFLPISVLTECVRMRRLYFFHVCEIQVRHVRSREHAVLTIHNKLMAAMNKTSYNDSLDAPIVATRVAIT
jgi:hypothetical protein